MGSLRPRFFHQLTGMLSLAALLVAPAARAQEPPPYIAVLDGTASFEREGNRDTAVAGMPLLDGDVLSTDAGRLEVIFADRSVLDVDEYSSVEFGASSQFQVVEGRVSYSGAHSPQPTGVLRGDAFGQWVQARRQERLSATASTQYLPSALQSYGTTFDREGAWQYEAPYGNVWYPAVASDWRPYYNGYWSSLQPYGWTWIGYNRWAWPTHHYGRWGYARSRWFWIPGRTWGPAWVTWASAPGYVSWCPLGFNNRPVFSLSVNIGNAWGGWVVLDRAHFGARDAPVNRYALDGRRLGARTPFVTQARAPLAGGDAPGRSYAAERPAGPAPRRYRAAPTDQGRLPQPESTRPTARVPDRGRSAATVQGRSPRVEPARPLPLESLPATPVAPAMIDRRPATARNPRQQPPQAEQPQFHKAVPSWVRRAGADAPPAIQPERAPEPTRVRPAPQARNPQPQAEQPQFRRAVPSWSGRPAAPAPAVQPQRTPEPIRTRPAPRDDNGTTRGGGTEGRGKARSARR